MALRKPRKPSGPAKVHARAVSCAKRHIAKKTSKSKR